MTTGKFGASQFYRAEWKDGKNVEKWLSRMATGTTLNFPCGTSQWGEVRVDIDKSLGPDLVADIRDPPFDNRAYDTVYCDPPYSLCAYDTIWDWVMKIWDVTNKRLIINMPSIRVPLSGSRYSLFVEHRPPTPAMALYHVYDRVDSRLSDYDGNQQ